MKNSNIETENKLTKEDVSKYVKEILQDDVLYSYDLRVDTGQMAFETVLERFSEPNKILYKSVSEEPLLFKKLVKFEVATKEALIHWLENGFTTSDPSDVWKMVILKNEKIISKVIESGWSINTLNHKGGKDTIANYAIKNNININYFITHPDYKIIEQPPEMIESILDKLIKNDDFSILLKIIKENNSIWSVMDSKITEKNYLKRSSSLNISMAKMVVFDWDIQKNMEEIDLIEKEISSMLLETAFKNQWYFNEEIPSENSEVFKKFNEKVRFLTIKNNENQMYDDIKDGGLQEINTKRKIFKF